MPTVWKRPRLSGDRRAEVAAELRAQYERGASIRNLMDTTGFSYAKVHKLLAEVGTSLRGRGGDQRSARSGRSTPGAARS